MSAGKPIRVLVVDDAAIFRKVIRDALDNEPGIEVVGTAANGIIALDRIKEFEPDLITLDIEMPELDGLGVLQKLRETNSNVRAIMVSAATSEGASTTVAALRSGATDFITKPAGLDFAKSTAELRDALIPKIRSAAGARQTPIASLPQEPARPTESQRSRIRLPLKPEVVGIGVSTGGPDALSRVLPLLPETFPVPILVVQHMPKFFTKTLASSLDDSCALSVCEGHDGQRVERGNIYVAPGGFHMKVVKEGGARLLRMTEDPPECGSRPSVDYLFRSIAEQFGARALAVVLTGMGDDGTAGSRLLRSKDAGVFVQDEASCAVYGMPRGPAEEGTADLIVPLDKMAEKITQTVRTGIIG